MSLPNILFIIADDHRFSAIHALQEKSVATPFLDRLITEGTTMRAARILGSCQGAVCIPTRASIHTGVNHFKNAVPDNDCPGMVLKPEYPLLAETFRQAGYHTFATGKWHNDHASFNRSFCDAKAVFFGGMADHYQTPVTDFDPTGTYADDERRIEPRHSTEVFCDAATAFIETYEGKSPFFAYLALTSPHDPRTAPQPFHQRYPADSIALPPNFMPEHPFDNGELQVRDELLAEHPRREDAARQHIADYYAMISHHDHELARVYQALEQRGWDDNTIIVYLADHGLAVGQHGLMGKQNVYDHSIRVPLIISGPGIAKGQKRSEPVYSYDIHPTLLDCAGVAQPPTIEAKSFFPALHGQAFQPRETLYSHHRTSQATVTDGRWKLICYYRDGKDGFRCFRRQLFDLEADAYETNDVIDDPGLLPVVKKLSQAMSAWQERLGDPIAAKLNP